MITLRPYQQQAVDAVYAYLREKDGNPLVVSPTGSGKSCLIAQIATDAVQRWDGRVLVLAHVQELLEQNADKIRRMAQDLNVGIYSAGLGIRDTLSNVICGGIQSCYRRAHEFGHFDLVIVDEAHCVPPDGEGMYRTLLASLKRTNPHLRLIGLTATPFRMSSGHLCGPESLFSEVCFEISVKELIAQGYLCPLITKAGIARVDTSGLHVRGGEYIAGEVEKLMDDHALIEAACKEIVEYTKERQSCLIFASGVQHGTHVAEMLKSLGQKVSTIFGDTLDFIREQTIADFRAGRLKYLVNVNVLTTGFDAPNIDCVAMLRPTLSPGLFYQCCGRGFRLHPNKQNCLVLDFGGNALRHGPVDALRIKVKSDSDGENAKAPAKECPECHTVMPAGCTQCPGCGYQFERSQTKHEATASDEGILSGQATNRKYRVLSVRYSVHIKRNAPPDAPRTMRVEYQIGYNAFRSEWICIEHSGYARLKAEKWWSRRSGEPVPSRVEEAVDLAEAGALTAPKAITVRHIAGEQYDRIVGYEFDQTSAPVSEPEYVPACDDIPF